MTPEISRRCLACGAAVRPGARFCPQCGRTTEAGGDGGAAGAETMREEVPLETAWGEWEESLRGGAPKAEAQRPSASAPPPPAPAVPEPKAGPVETPPAPPEPTVPPAPAPVREPVSKPSPSAVAEPGPLERPRPSAERGGRAAAVKESLRPRVERVREASRGVFEEAAEDSGLRFVLISVALFLVFLLFLLFNSRLK